MVRQFKFLSFFLLTVLSLFMISAESGAVFAASAKTSPQKSSVDWKDLIKKADPYVRIVNHIAVIDPQINQHLSADDVNLVKGAVKIYNSLPLTIRQNTQVSGTLSPRSSGYQWHYNVYWWGVRIYINSPAAQSFGTFMSITGGAIGAAIGGIIGAAGGAIVGAIVGGVTGFETAFDDNSCGNRGVFIDVPWYFVATHPTPVC